MHKKVKGIIYELLHVGWHRAIEAGEQGIDAGYDVVVTVFQPPRESVK